MKEILGVNGLKFKYIDDKLHILKQNNIIGLIHPIDYRYFDIDTTKNETVSLLTNGYLFPSFVFNKICLNERVRVIASNFKDGLQDKLNEVVIVKTIKDSMFYTTCGIVCRRYNLAKLKDNYTKYYKLKIE